MGFARSEGLDFCVKAVLAALSLSLSLSLSTKMLNQGRWITVLLVLVLL
jgi:hypothetical protein